MNKINSAPLVITILTFITFLIYFPGLSGGFYYDDFRPLSSLNNISNLNEALYYIFTEISGPLGRPISMMTFLLNIGDYEVNNSHFFLINITIHAINVVLVYFIVRLLGNLLAIKNISKISLITALFWLVIPLNVSTSLIAIQRMAGLSALFVLAGIAAYLNSKRFELNNPIKAIKIQILSVFSFSLLACFSKENGALLPIFILVIEVTLLRNINSSYQYKKLVERTLIASLMAILLYLVYYVIKTQGEYPTRTFDMLQRVATQPYIMFDYVRLSFIPSLFSYNPFHDNYVFIENVLSIKGIVGLLFWLTVPALFIYLRSKTPWLSFVVLWFLTAHLIESTVIGLEMYFEHRNYLALIGLLFCLVVKLFDLKTKFKNAYLLLFASYLLLLALSTFQVNKIWGDPIKASIIWNQQQKGSVRASEHLALQFLENGRTSDAYNVINSQVTHCPNCIASRSQRMLIGCVLKLDIKEDLNFLLTEIKGNNLAADNSAALLGKVDDQITKGNCNQINFEQLNQINKNILALDTVYGKYKLPFLFNLQNIAAKEEKWQEAISYLDKAWNEVKSPRILLLKMTHQESLNNLNGMKHTMNSICSLQVSNIFEQKENNEFCNMAKNKILNYKGAVQ